MSKQQEELLTKELDTLENAISDENHALAVCSREEIWKIVYRIVDLAVAEERKRIVEELEIFANELPDELQVTGCGQLQRVSSFIKKDILSLITKEN